MLVDTTYFGERQQDTIWCLVVFRDAYSKEDIWWEYSLVETTISYLRGRKALEDLGYEIISVTGDGFGGIRQAFKGVPLQMCHVHMERIIIRETTRKPKLEAGIELLALVRTLKTTNSVIFRKRLHLYVVKYRDFLNEKTINPETGGTFWTHQKYRKAFHSLNRFEEYLFTYEQNSSIPKTTNSLEGHFRHINEISAVHCGLSRGHKQRLLDSIMLAGTIAPSDKKLEEIL